MKGKEKDNANRNWSAEHNKRIWLGDGYKVL